MDALVGCVLCAPVAALLALRWYITRTVTCPYTTKLRGKVIVVTGATSGIGRATAMECAVRDATVVLACRDRVRAEATVTAIRRKTGNEKVHYLPLNLSSCQSVVEFAAIFNKQYATHLDVLVNNAAYMGPKKKSQDGLDLVFQTNVLGPFLLSKLMIHNSQPSKEKPLRVINLVSDSLKLGELDLDDLQFERRYYDLYPVYGASKLALLLITMETNFRYGDQGVVATAVHPGPVRSGLLRYWPGIFGDVLRLMARLVFRSPEDGAHSILYAVTVPDLIPFQGKIIYDCQEWGSGAQGGGREEKWRRQLDYKAEEGLWTRCQGLSEQNIARPQYLRGESLNEELQATCK